MLLFCFLFLRAMGHVLCGKSTVGWAAHAGECCEGDIPLFLAGYLIIIG